MTIFTTTLHTQRLSLIINKSLVMNYNLESIFHMLKLFTVYLGL